jgi:hypothetical protein
LEPRKRIVTTHTEQQSISADAVLEETASEHRKRDNRCIEATVGDHFH